MKNYTLTRDLKFELLCHELVSLGKELYFKYENYSNQIKKETEGSLFNEKFDDTNINYYLEMLLVAKGNYIRHFLKLTNKQIEYLQIGYNFIPFVLNFTTVDNAVCDSLYRTDLKPFKTMFVTPFSDFLKDIKEFEKTNKGK